jgi:hypothetical protein
VLPVTHVPDRYAQISPLVLAKAVTLVMSVQITCDAAGSVTAVISPKRKQVFQLCANR